MQQQYFMPGKHNLVHACSETPLKKISNWDVTGSRLPTQTRDTKDWSKHQKWAQTVVKPKDGVSKTSSVSPEFLGRDPYSCRKAEADLCTFWEAAADIWWALWIELLIHCKMQEKTGENKSSQFKLLTHSWVGEGNVKKCFEARQSLGSPHSRMNFWFDTKYYSE